MKELMSQYRMAANYTDADIKKKIIEMLTKDGKVSSLDMEINNSKKDYLRIRRVLGELYGHDFLYSQILRTPENLIVKTDKMLYRVFLVTKKFSDAVDKGERIE